VRAREAAVSQALFGDPICLRRTQLTVSAGRFRRQPWTTAMEIPGRMRLQEPLTDGSGTRRAAPSGKGGDPGHLKITGRDAVVV
jgi:hypothetical protein